MNDGQNSVVISVIGQKTRSLEVVGVVFDEGVVEPNASSGSLVGRQYFFPDLLMQTPKHHNHQSIITTTNVCQPLCQHTII